MKSPKELLGQVVGRGGHPAIVEHVRKIDPEQTSGSADERAELTEGDLRPHFDTEIKGAPFAPIEGYMSVKSGPTSFRHHGFYVVDMPYRNMKPARRQEEYVKPAEAHLAARVPGEVMPGEDSVDLASTSLIPPTVDELGLRSSVDASYQDLRHLARGSPHLASHN